MTSTPASTPDYHLAEPLTAREEEILPLIAEGLSNREIADRLLLGTATVKWYNLQIYDKFGLEKPYRSRRWAVYCAREMGLLPALGEEGSHEPPGDNPYKGLDAFQQEDADLFFGREAFTEHLLGCLSSNGDRPRFLAVVGPSGSGKSSVVRAGLLAALDRNALPGASDWAVASMFPGLNPFFELEASLRGVAVKHQPDLLEMLQRDSYGLARVSRLLLAESQPLLLVIDQFEELFTLVEEAATARAFMDAIYAAVTDPRSSVRVVITLRADFLDRPLMYPDFSWLVQEQTALVGPLTPDELERAITLPSQHAHVTIESGVVAKLVAEANEQPGALPLLQFALTELYDNRVGNTITLSAYEEIGGLEKTLAAQADKIYADLSAEQRAAARQLFLRLITLGEGTEDMRRRVALTELAALDVPTETLDYVVQFLVANRLLTMDRDPASGEPAVEVAHEALIREWGLLRGWLDESRNDIRLQRQLAQMAEEWQRANQDASYLLGGLRLEQMEAWAEVLQLALTENESRFLEASIAERNRHRAREQARQKREAALERRAVQQLRRLVAVFAVATVIALGLSIFAFKERSTAQSARATAIVAQNDALAQAATAVYNQDVSSTLMLATQAEQVYWNEDMPLGLSLLVTINQTSAAKPMDAQATLANLAFAPGSRRQFVGGHTQPALSVAFSPDGRTAVSGGFDGPLVLWDVASGEVLHTFIGHTDRVHDVAFSPDGQHIASASRDKTVMLWDAASGEAVFTLSGHTDWVWSVAFTPDGQTVVSASGASDEAIIWDVVRGEALRTFDMHQPEMVSMTLSPDGQLMATTAHAGEQTLILWDVASGEALPTFSDQSDAALNAAFSPDGKYLATASATIFRDHTVILWDLASGEALHTFSGHKDWVWSVAFSPDGKSIASASNDRTVRLWDVESGKALHTFRGHQRGVNEVAFSPDGQTIISASEDGTLILWDLESSEVLNTFGQLRGVLSVAVSPDSQRMASGAGRVVTLWGVESGEALYSSNTHIGDVNDIAFSPDGDMFATASSERFLTLWDVASGEALLTLDGHTDDVNGVAFSPDSARILSASADATVKLWDLSTGEMLSEFSGHEDEVLSVAFSPDGGTFVSGSADQTVKVWDVASGEALRTFDGHTDDVNDVAFGPDGARIGSASADGIAIVWDVASGDLTSILSGHLDDVNSLMFSPDGQSVATVSSDDTVKVWQVESGRLLRHFSGHTNDVLDVAFSPDGRSLISASADRTLVRWRIDDLEELIEWIEANRYLPELSCEQRQQFSVALLCDTDRQGV